MNKQWVTQQSYDHTRTRVDHKAMLAKPGDYGYTEDQVVSRTIPGQAISIRELMDRHEKGRPIPEE